MLIGPAEAMPEKAVAPRPTQKALTTPDRKKLRISISFRAFEAGRTYRPLAHPRGFPTAGNDRPNSLITSRRTDWSAIASAQSVKVGLQPHITSNHLAKKDSETTQENELDAFRDRASQIDPRVLERVQQSAHPSVARMGMRLRK
jgi:hypothetical protein